MQAIDGHLVRMVYAQGARDVQPYACCSTEILSGSRRSFWKSGCSKPAFRPLSDCRTAIKTVWPERRLHRFNCSTEGRGGQHFSARHREHLARMLSYYPATGYHGNAGSGLDGTFAGRRVGNWPTCHSPDWLYWFGSMTPRGIAGAADTMPQSSIIPWYSHLGMDNTGS
jgi:hypothetical protein